MYLRTLDQLASSKMRKRNLHGALGQSCPIGNVRQAQRNLARSRLAALSGEE
jgi:hypothetical protein